MNIKYIIGFFLLITFSSTRAQQNNTAKILVWSDQKVAITGEEIWIDGYYDQPLNNIKSVTLRLVDRNGQTKSEVDVIPQRNSFSGFLSIPESLVSDYYFLDCFTKGLNTVTRLQPIMIINPRLAPQGICQSNSSPLTFNNNSQIAIKTTRETFAPRSIVRLELELPPALENISLSAVMHDQLSAKMDSLTQLFPISFLHNSNGEIENEGQVITVTASINGLALKNTKLIVALKGTKAIVGTNNTDENGIAKFILPLTYDTRSLVVTTLDDKKIKPNFKISKTVGDQQLIQFPCLLLDESMRQSIETRLLNNRVTNKFYGANTKVIETIERDTTDFYGTPDIAFQLDDYVRFPNMEEVIIEIIPQLRVRKNKNEMFLQVLNSPYKSFFEKEALVLIDGIPVNDHKTLIEADPLLIKSIEIINKKYMQGSTEFNGVVHFKTYRGDAANIQLKNIDGNYILNGIQESATFQNANHGKQKDRLPDFRNLLWRDANLNNDQIKSGLKYFTSDAEGNFKIIVRGINAYKEMIIGEKIITVSQQDQ